MAHHIDRRRDYRSQSAMEYLMTYGWAILIIAVVLSVLFQLGVFSSGNFQPHAQAGSCQVSRTVAGVSLEGQCNGMLPQFVAQFNGASSYISIPSINGLASSAGQFNTVSFWVYINSLSLQQIPVSFVDYDIWIESSTCIGLNTGNSDAYGFNPSGLQGKWINVVLVLNNGVYTNNALIYVNGVQQTIASCGSNGPVSQTVTAPLFLGQFNNGAPAGFYLSGQLANVQVYNVSLSSSEVQALYLEGIGGAPIRPQNTVGWWPLNGNANDYSGNNNNGQLSSVTFSSSWESGYTAP